MAYTYFPKSKSLLEILKRIEKIEGKIFEIEKEIKKLPKFSLEKTLEIYCPVCKNYHKVPYVPGTHALCDVHDRYGYSYSYVVNIIEEGKIFTERVYLMKKQK